MKTGAEGDTEKPGDETTDEPEALTTEGEAEEGGQPEGAEAVKTGAEGDMEKPGDETTDELEALTTEGEAEEGGEGTKAVKTGAEGDTEEPGDEITDEPAEKTGTEDIEAELQKVGELEEAKSKCQSSESELKMLKSKYESSESKFETLKSKFERSESELQAYQDNFQKYNHNIARFEEEGGRKDYEIMEKAQTDFDRWKACLLKFVGSFDDLYYDLMELIEDKANAWKPKRVMSFPINMRDKEKTFETMSALLKDMKKELDESGDFASKLPDNLLTLKGVNVRGGSDLDCFLADENFSRELLVLQKQSLNTILLTLKNLLKTPQEMLKVLEYALKAEEKVRKELHYFDPDDLAKALSSKEDTLLESILGETDRFLQENFKTARDAEEIADKFRKKYFDLINKTLIKTYNALGEASKHYRTSHESLRPNNSEAPRIEKWKELYDSLQKSLSEYMEKQDIKRIECKRGDEYDDQLHKPYGTAEPDEELANNRVKTIVNVGFKFSTGEDGDEDGIVVKPTDIIVVNNALQ